MTPWRLVDVSVPSAPPTRIAMPSADPAARSSIDEEACATVRDQGEDQQARGPDQEQEVGDVPEPAGESGKPGDEVGGGGVEHRGSGSVERQDDRAQDRRAEQHAVGRAPGSWSIRCRREDLEPRGSSSRLIDVGRPAGRIGHRYGHGSLTRHAGLLHRSSVCSIASRRRQGPCGRWEVRGSIGGEPGHVAASDRPPDPTGVVGEDSAGTHP